MKNSSKSLKTLGPVSSYLVQQLLKEERSVFRSQDVCRILEKDQKSAADLLAEMVKRQILFRIKPGLFLIIPLESDAGYLGNWYVAAREMMNGHGYYIGYYSAMSFHGMTTNPVKDVFIVSSTRRQNRSVSGVFFYVHYIHPGKFFGMKKYWQNSNEQIYFSDQEKTIIDGLDRPDLCGGVAEVAKGMCLKKHEFNWSLLTDYAIKLKVYAVAKRLGFLMETLSLGSEKETARLKAFIDPSRAYVLLDPSLPSGKDSFQSRWKVRINFNIEEIAKSMET